MVTSLWLGIHPPSIMWVDVIESLYILMSAVLTPRTGIDSAITSLELPVTTSNGSMASPLGALQSEEFVKMIEGPYDL